MNQNDISKRQNDIQNDTGKKLLSHMDIFQSSSDRAFFGYAKKIEKIVAAIYLITDVMDADLPLTHTLRTESLELVNACYRLITKNSGFEPREIAQTAARIEHVTSLVHIGRIARHISEMNAAVITEELTKVLEMMHGEVKSIQEKIIAYARPTLPQPTLSRAIMDDPLFDSLSHERKMLHRAEQAKKSLSPALPIKTTLTTSINDINDNVVNKQNQNDILKPKTTIKTTPENIKWNIDRKQEIMNAIKAHKNATMHDIKMFLPGWSEKTIQREIMNLVESGLVTRQGNKRWAFYILNDAA